MEAPIRILNQNTELQSLSFGSFSLTSAVENPLFCRAVAISEKMVIMAIKPQSDGESRRPRMMPNTSPSNCCMPLFIPPQKSPFAVFSFSDSIILLQRYKKNRHCPNNADSFLFILSSRPNRVSGEISIRLLYNLLSFDNIDASWQTIERGRFRLHFLPTEVKHIKGLSISFLNALNSCRTLNRQDVLELLPYWR